MPLFSPDRQHDVKVGQKWDEVAIKNGYGIMKQYLKNQSIDVKVGQIVMPP